MTTNLTTPTTVGSTQLPTNGADSAATNAQADAATPAFLRFENLSKSYQEGDRTRVVLHEADAVFAQGRICRHPGPQRQRQKHAAQPDQRHRPGRQRPHLARRAGAHRARRPPAHPLPPPLDRLCLPVLQLDPNPDRVGERDPAAGAQRRKQREVRQRAEPLLDAVGLLDRVRPSPTASPAANNSASPSPAPWSTTPNWSSPTSPPATWTKTPANTSWPCSTT